MRLFKPSFLLFTLLICSCASFTKYGKLEKSARQYYQRANYDNAVMDCVESLRINPDYEKAQILLQNAHKSAIDYHARKIQEFVQSTEKFKWDNIVSEIKEIQNINNIIRELPPLINKKTNFTIKFKTPSYDKVLLNAINKAAEIHYQEGKNLSQRKDVEIQKQAAKEFKKTMEYIPNYKDSEISYNKCRQSGTKRMAIIPFTDNTGKGNKYGSISNQIYDNIVSYIFDNSAMEFLQIISRDRIQQVLDEQRLGMTGLIDQTTAAQVGKMVGVHEIVMGNINSIIYSPPNMTSHEEEEKNTLILMREVKGEDGQKKQEIYTQDVYATVTIYEKFAGCKVSGSYKIIDVQTAQLKDASSLSGQYEFYDTWATYGGDERAVQRNNNLIVKLPQIVPVEEEIVIGGLNNLSYRLADKLINYAR